MQVSVKPDAWGTARASIAVTVPELGAWTGTLTGPCASAIICPRARCRPLRQRSGWGANMLCHRKNQFAGHITVGDPPGVRHVFSLRRMDATVNIKYLSHAAACSELRSVAMRFSRVCPSGRGQYQCWMPPFLGIMSMQSTGHGSTQRSQPVHSSMITVCMSFAAPRMHPQDTLECIWCSRCTRPRGCTQPWARLRHRVRVQWLRFNVEQIGRLDRVFTAGRTLVDRVAVGNRLGVGPASRVAALTTLGLGQYRIDLVESGLPSTSKRTAANPSKAPNAMAMPTRQPMREEWDCQG